jgi:hypothetical protein
MILIQKSINLRFILIKSRFYANLKNNLKNIMILPIQFLYRKMNKIEMDQPKV